MEVEEYNIWPHLPADAFPAIFTRSAIFASVLIAVPVITIGIGLTKPHGQIVDSQKYPWSSMGKIGGIGGFCTGAVIGPNQFLTAAHCLYDKTRFLSAGSIHILVGYEKGEYRAHRVASRYTIPTTFDPSLYTYPLNPKGWIAAHYDWAIVYTDEPFPPDVKPLRLASTTSPLGTTVKIGGYTTERPYMMTADPHCRIGGGSLDGNLISHDCVVHHGTSGGPLLSGDDEGLILGVGIFMYSPGVEPGEQSKEGGWAVSAASITEFIGSQAVGTVESQKAIPGSVR
ncbi:MAG: trypsin-like serine protease [Pseudolabrys sp.]